MKIKFESVDLDKFIIREHDFYGENVYLIIPKHIGVSWDKSNLQFRSSVYNANGELISASFPKFFNLGEKPALYSNPDTFRDQEVLEKVDGSTLVVSKYNGNLMIRTRGTVDATQLVNGHEIDFLMKKYPLAFSFEENDNSSRIFEWVSPHNKMVIDYGDEPDLYLIGIINHFDYSLISQNDLDVFASKYEVKRPKRFNFSTLKDIVSSVEKFDDMEGVCLYYNNGQNIVKIKGEWYLKLHHLKSELSSFEKVLDVWFERNRPSYTDFYNYIAETFDYEIAEYVRGNISKICDAYKEVEKIVNHMHGFVDDRLKPILSKKGQSGRKDCAKLVFDSYGKTNRASYVFNILDDKPLTNDDYKKLIFQVLK